MSTRSLHHRPVTSSVAAAGLALALGLATGCSVFFPFSECEAGGDCPSGRCIDGVCAPAAVDVARPVEGTLTDGDVWEGTIQMTGPVYVPAGRTLNIAPGTEVRGQRSAALIVRPGGILLADGTREAPIVFTSSEPVGSRAAGDWGGVALLGDAPVNAPEDERYLEGAPNGEQIAYGGADPLSSCGVLRYVRIAFAGQVAGEGDELNGLTLAGCGSGTIVDHVQVHRGKDDGVEVFGGTVDLRYIVVTETLDDAFDYDLGWQGGLRFLAVTQLTDGGTDDPSGIEGSGQAEEASAPVPLIYNVTLLGCPGCDATSNANVLEGAGLRLKGGASGELGNLLIADWYAGALRIQDPETVENLMAATLALGPTVVGLAGSGVRAQTSDAPFDADAWLASLVPDDGIDPLPPVDSGPIWTLDHGDPALAELYDGPQWVPSANAFAGRTASRRDDERIGEAAAYFGAFVPGGADWTAGWTDYAPR